MYPCPKCREDRPGLHAACVHCDWAPDEPEPEAKPDKFNPPFEHGRTIKLTNKAAFFIGIGCCLFISALGLVLVTKFFGGFDWWATVGVIQMLAGLSFVLFGFLSNKRSNKRNPG